MQSLLKHNELYLPAKKKLQMASLLRSKSEGNETTKPFRIDHVLLWQLPLLSQPVSNTPVVQMSQ